MMKREAQVGHCVGSEIYWKMGIESATKLMVPALGSDAMMDAPHRCTREMHMNKYIPR
jgi:hypothetical protein